MNADGKARNSIRCVHAAGANNTLPLELGLLEIEQQRKLKTRYRQVTDHLRDVRFVERRDHFWIGDYCVVNNQIRRKPANFLALIEYRMLLLLVHLVPALSQL